MKPSYGGIADGWERRGTGADREADAHGIPWHRGETFRDALPNKYAYIEIVSS